MSRERWDTFEEKARGIAALVFGKECRRQIIAGIAFDGTIHLSALELVLVEASIQFDLDKVRQGVTRVTTARLSKVVDGVVVRGYIVLPREPTPAMEAAATENNVIVLSLSQLAAMFFEFPRYAEARNQSAFGSSIDPLTGNIDTTDYVPVSYENLSNGGDIDVNGVAEALLAGRSVVLLGEYGSGKSRCVRQIFRRLAEDWDKTFKFPCAINLRECWGLDQGDEIARRAMRSLGLDDLQGRAVRALNQSSFILLFDGFDEIGSQAWSADEARLRELRFRALAGARDAINRSGTGSLIAGREHYFSSNEEMFRALGLNADKTLLLKARDQFTDEQLEQYFETANLAVELPSWLPRRPLICQTIALLSDEELSRMFGVEAQEASFWNHFIKVVCERDARINSYFDADTIYRVFIELSRVTRNRAANVGPLSQRDLQDAFESVVGQLPSEEASVMLLRLPSLGRVAAQSSDRQFVDVFILDGLRAKDVSRLVDMDDAGRRKATHDKWANPLSPLGLAVLSEDLASRINSFVTLAESASKSENATLACDILAAACILTDVPVDMKGLSIDGGVFSLLDWEHSKVTNCKIDNSIIEHLVVPNIPPINVTVQDTLVGKVSGVASFGGSPAWIKLSGVDDFDSVRTVSQIRKVGLSPAHEVLVAILKKTFQQKGAGRKEEALLRGFRAGQVRGIADALLGLLMREDIVGRHKGDEGWVYTPNRKQSARINVMLEQLKASTDSLWTQTGELN